MIERIYKDDHYDNVIIVEKDDGIQLRYLFRDGVMYPGRIWQSMTPPGHSPAYTVTFFIPLPDGAPEILRVTAY